MNYATWSDCLERYPSLSRVGSVTSVSSVYLNYASRRIDGLLSRHFTVPFSSNNLTAKDLTLDLVYINAGNNKVKERDQLRKEFMDRIKALQLGTEAMLTDDGAVTLQSVGDTVYMSTADYVPVFGMGSIEDFHPDSSQLYDEEWSRGW